MKLLVSVLLILALSITVTTSAYAQQPQLASYRETAHILVDQLLQNQTTAFITLASTSPVEMRVPTEISEKIQNTANVTSVVVTNADNCVVGVQDKGCVIVVINSPALIATYNITKIQTDAHNVGDNLIGDINKAFALNAQFNDVYVNPRGDLTNALGTNGAVSGNRTISVVYTMDKPDSGYLFDGLTGILIPKQIRDEGGFYNTASKLAQSNSSSVTFVITPGQDVSLYQLQVAKHFPIKNKITTIKPLEFFGVDKIERSGYFSSGFFPVNSVLDVTVLSKDNISITGNGGDLAPTVIKNGQKFPSDLTKAGWIFDPESGQKISGVYLFGKTTSITSDVAYLTLGASSDKQNTITTPIVPNPPPSEKPNYSVYALIGIVAAGGAAVYLFMKRR